MPGSPTEGADLAALILAGGQATRLGGGDKPLHLLASRPILAHVIGRIARPGLPLAISANGDATRFSAFGLPVIADSISGFAGPLAGILAGMDWAAKATNASLLLSAPGDCPFLPPDLSMRLIAARNGSDQPITCARSGGRMHPVVALWPLTLREPLREAIMAGERRVGAFAARFGCVNVEWEAEPADPFFNINTPDDLAAAERLAASAYGSDPF